MSADRSSSLADADGNELGKVFIGGLSQATNEASLRAYFGQYGQIDDAVVMMDNQTGRSRGFGFIKFKDFNCVDAVLQCQGHTIDSKAVDVKQSNIHAKGKVSRNLKIFVGGIAPEHDVRVMQSFFSQYGKVADVNLMLDQSKQRHRGFAFVTFDDEKVVQQLVQLHFVNINGRVVEIKAMRPTNFGQRESNGGRIAEQQQTPIIYQQPQPAAAAAAAAAAATPAPMWHPAMTFDPGMPVAWTPAAWPSAGQQWCSSQFGVFDNAWPQTLVTAWPSGIMPAPSPASAAAAAAATTPLLQPVAWDFSQQQLMQQQQQQQFVQQQMQQQLQQRSHLAEQSMSRICQPQHHHYHQPQNQQQQHQSQQQPQPQQQQQQQQQQQPQPQQELMEEESCSSRSSSTSSRSRCRQQLDPAWSLSANAFKEAASHQQIHHFLQAQHHNHRSQQLHYSHHPHQVHQQHQQQQQLQPSSHVAAGDYDTQQQTVTAAVTMQREP